MAGFSVDVSHLRPVKTARLKLGVQPNAKSAPVTTLIGVHAGRGNAPFVNAIMKVDGEYNTALSPRQLDDGDLRRAEIFARTVITGWEGPCMDDSSPAPYSPELLMQVFQALIEAKRSDVVIATLRYFADADNFTEGAQASEVLGKE
jgi:hypothetical protein